MKMSKYLNLKIAIDGESVNIYIETGAEPIHVVYWHLDEWIEDAESSVPAAINAVHLYHTNPDELIERISGVGMPDYKNMLITNEEVSQFLDNWGQTHEEICSELGYDEEDSDDLIMGDDYFWYEEKELWCNKDASGFEGKDQMIADYLRHDL
jgi:hypothetical protein